MAEADEGGPADLVLSTDLEMEVIMNETEKLLRTAREIVSGQRSGVSSAISVHGRLEPRACYSGPDKDALEEVDKLDAWLADLDSAVKRGVISLD